MMQTHEDRPRAAGTIRPRTLNGGGGGDPWTRLGRSAGRIRGVLPGLILGAGLALAGCGDDSSTTAPAPAPAPPPAPAAPAPVGLPGGLKVTASGPDFLEFGWEAVEGATGYEIQLSLKEGDFSAVSTATVTTTMHRFEVAAATTGWARVRAQEGERQSEWSETATGRSAAAPVPPVTLSAPVPEVTGSGPDYIEWSWEAVPDALSYEVRVAATEEGLDAASPETITETRHRVTAEPETEMFVRVRAVAGTTESPIVSDWSDSVSGVSDIAPRPFVVGMSPPQAGADGDCAGQALCPDDGTDPAKATARVNPRMLVSSSHRARVTPLFLEGAAGVTVEAGEALTPFTYAEWNLLQRMAVDEGAVFEFRQITGGAGQEATPSGNARYITCGPFRCSGAAAEPPAAPVMSAADAAVCEDFEVEFRLIEGAFRNFQQVLDIGGYRLDWPGHGMGLEFGWEYRLSHTATVTHEFPGIAAATPSGTMTVPGAPLEVTSTWRVLDMAPDPDPDSLVNKFGSPLNRDGDRTTQSAPGPIRNGSDDCFEADFHQIDPLNGVNPRPTYPSFRRSRGVPRTGEADPVRRPESCAVLVTDGYYGSYSIEGPAPEIRFHDYLASGYLLQVDPQVGVSWLGSEVAWGEDDPFENLRCERVTIPVEYDKCERFREEVEAFWGGGIGAGNQYRLEFFISGNSNHNGRHWRLVVRNDIPQFSGGSVGQAGDEWRPRSSRHASMWLVRPEPGTPGLNNNYLVTHKSNFGIDGTKRDYDLYRVWSYSDSGVNHGNVDWMVGAREAPTSQITWQPIMGEPLVDSDSDPKYGDLGKIDMEDADGNPGSDGDPENWDGNEDADSCSADDGGEELCDAVVEIPLSATFVLIRDTETCATEVELPLTCTWDADGDRRRGGDTTFPAGPDPRRNGGSYFLECVVR